MLACLPSLCFSDFLKKCLVLDISLGVDVEVGDQVEDTTQEGLAILGTGSGDLLLVEMIETGGQLALEVDTKGEDVLGIVRVLASSLAHKLGVNTGSNIDTGLTTGGGCAGSAGLSSRCRCRGFGGSGSGCWGLDGCWGRCWGHNGSRCGRRRLGRGRDDLGVGHLLGAVLRQKLSVNVCLDTLQHQLGNLGIQLGHLPLNLLLLGPGNIKVGIRGDGGLDSGSKDLRRASPLGLIDL